MFSEKKDYRRKKFLFIPVAIVAVVLLLGWAVMLLWNAILPKVAAVSALTYWQAVGLLVLSRILFGGFRGGKPSSGPGMHWREKWRKMSEEDRARFKEEWQARCKKWPS